MVHSVMLLVGVIMTCSICFAYTNAYVQVLSFLSGGAEAPPPPPPSPPASYAHENLIIGDSY